MADALFIALAEAGYRFTYNGERVFAAHKTGIDIVASVPYADGTRKILVNGEDEAYHDRSKDEWMDWLVRVELKYG